jgi:DNA uptake protein ComE-like DNA-binding protein
MKFAAGNGSVLVIVLWIALGLVSIALYFANSMALEMRAADNRVAGMAADEAIEGAKRYMLSMLSQYATNGTMPDLTQYHTEAVPVGDAKFWIIGRDNSDPPAHPNQVTFGLIDEAAKLNLNSASTNRFNGLDRMTDELATAIIDWRSTNGTFVSDMYYSMLGYQAKHAPLETVDELNLVDGASKDILVGNDVNRNGILDPNETAGNITGQIEPGIFDYVTVYSREPNIHSDGSSRTNVNDQAQIRALLQSRFGNTRANQIVARFTRSSPAPGGGRTTTFVTVNNLLQWYLQSGMSLSEFDQIYNDITVGTAPYRQGRVNINTAPVAVLACLRGMDYTTAKQVVAYRQQNSGNLTSIAWIVDALGATSDAIQQLQQGDYITTKTFQFTADIAAVGPYGRGYRRVKFVFDIADGMPKVVYRQDLSRLGWALGDDVRQQYAVKTTP